MNQLNIPDVNTYFRILQNKNTCDNELIELVEILANQETYFFREPLQLDIFVSDIFDAIKRSKDTVKKNTIKIWSTGCSSGEEPYSIAILILEMGIPAGMHIDIAGFDISEKSLRVARDGKYRLSSFRHMDAVIKARYFKLLNGDVFLLNKKVKNMVRFEQKNLLAEDEPDLMGSADVVFCRNVMMYFDNVSRKKLVSWLYRHIEPGGYLFLGHSESLLTMDSPFRDIRLKKEIIYQKPPVEQGTTM